MDWFYCWCKCWNDDFNVGKYFYIKQNKTRYIPWHSLSIYKCCMIFFKNKKQFSALRCSYTFGGLLSVLTLPYANVFWFGKDIETPLIKNWFLSVFYQRLSKAVIFFNRNGLFYVDENVFCKQEVFFFCFSMLFGWCCGLVSMCSSSHCIWTLENYHT